MMIKHGKSGIINLRLKNLFWFVKVKYT